MRLEPNRFIAESYFEFHSENNTTGNIGTSKRLFSKHPARPSTLALTTFLQGTPPVTANEIHFCKLHNLIVTTLFPQWWEELEVGCNLALFGYGSKTFLLNDFVVSSKAKNWHILRMKAFNKDSSFLALLQKISSEILTMERSERDILELTLDICRQLRVKPEPILIIIEMADAPIMRNSNIWSALATMAELPNVRMILSFEHVNALLLNSESIWSRMNLAWHDATTLRPYSSELDCLLHQSHLVSDNETKWRGAQFVLAGLTHTARSVFRVLAECQLSHLQPSQKSSTIDFGEEEEGEDDENPKKVFGLGLVTWYQKCQEQFIVSNELAFRTQLTEFLDHELVRAIDDAGQNGAAFYIPFDRTKIEMLIEISKTN